jgi:hypothetical protein
MTDSARIAVSSRRRLGAIDRAPRSPRRGARLVSSAADEEVVEGASDLLAIAALEDLRVDLEGDLRISQRPALIGPPWSLAVGPRGMSASLVGPRRSS